VWLVFGLLAGLAVSSFWPHEPLSAATSDREKNFGLMTVAVRDIQLAGVQDKQEGIFVLDYLTGRLQGAILNSRIGKFTHIYYRDLANDFNVDPNAGRPQYAMATGIAQLPTQGRVPWANGIVYIGELTSGRIHAYAFPYAQSRVKLPPIPIKKIDEWQFRQPLQRN
jgi:hypothetical protein